MMRAVRQPLIGHGIILALLVVSAGATRAVCVAPREREIKALAADRAKLEVELADFQRGVHDMDAWVREHPGHDLTKSRGRQALPSKDMVSAFLQALAPIGERHHVATDWIQPAGTPADELVADSRGEQVVYRRVELQFQVRAGYRELGEYLREIEEMDQLAVVRSVDLRFDAVKYPNLDANVRIWLYGRP
jgi:hypothetical protein